MLQAKLYVASGNVMRKERGRYPGRLVYQLKNFEKWSFTTPAIHYLYNVSIFIVCFTEWLMRRLRAEMNTFQFYLEK